MRTITLNDDDMREPCEHNDLVTCGHCGRSWCGTCNPTPSGRCLYEYDHDEDQEFAAFLARNDIKIDPNAPLAPHGGCNWSGCTTCFPPKDEVTTDTGNPYRDDADDEIKWRTPDYEAEFLDAASVKHVELLVDGEWVKFHPITLTLMPQANGPCPVCSEANGFHDDNMHRKNIDPKYMLEKGWHNAK